MPITCLVAKEVAQVSARIKPVATVGLKSLVQIIMLPVNAQIKEPVAVHDRDQNLQEIEQIQSVLVSWAGVQAVA